MSATIPLPPLAAWRMTEDRGPDSLTAHVQQMITLLHLRGLHDRDSRRSQAGQPDWLIVGPHGALWRELKTERGELTPAQRRVGIQLRTDGMDWAVWRPRDLFSGVIWHELLRISTAREDRSPS